MLVKRLTERERLVVILRHCDTLTIEETAAALDIDIQEVKRIEAAAIDQIKQILAAGRRPK